MSELPSYRKLKTHLSTTPHQRLFIQESRRQVSSILKGKDDRLLLIAGPCSIHDTKSAKEYAYRLKALSDSVSSHFFLIMRAYCEKARSAAGWKGLLYDPYLDGSHHIEKGLELTRTFLLELADLEIPTATEFLDPLTAPYYEDLITWGSIGARTSSSQPHRQLASGLEMPIGFKNGIAGNISSAVQGVAAASHPHCYLGLNEEGRPSIIKTKGNKDLHIVLRGGESGPNYSRESIEETLLELRKKGVPEIVIVDCSHQNSGKIPFRQKEAFFAVLNQFLEGNQAIRGFMLESHLFEGNQMHPNQGDDLKYGISITDSCLSWEATSSLVKEAFEKIQNTPTELVCR